MTSVIPFCSNDSAAVEVIPRPDVESPLGHMRITFRIDYICIGNDGQKVSENMAKHYMISGGQSKNM